MGKLRERKSRKEQINLKVLAWRPGWWRTGGAASWGCGRRRASRRGRRRGILRRPELGKNTLWLAPSWRKKKGGNGEREENDTWDPLTEWISHPFHIPIPPTKQKLRVGANPFQQSQPNMRRVEVIPKIWVGVAPTHPTRNQTHGVVQPEAWLIAKMSHGSMLLIFLQEY